MKKYFFLILILALFPLVSSVTLTETSLNHSIYINGSVTLNRLIINDTNIALFNLSSGGNFTNIVGSTQKIYFYDLTTPYDDLRWDNGTLIEENATNISVDIPTARMIYISGTGMDTTPPLITIINPKTGENENALPINFIIYTSESSTCDINIDLVSNISMTTSNNLNFTHSKDISNGLHNAYFYCNDTTGNQGNNSIEFYVYHTTSNSGGGGVDVIPDEKIFLENISIRYDDWYKNEDNVIYIYSYNSTGGFTDLTNISITSIPNVKNELARLGEGVYRGIFSIGDQADIILNITATDKDKIITELVTITLKDRSLIENLKDQVKDKGNKLADLFSDGLFWKILLGIAICFIIYYLIIIARRKKQ